MIPLDHDAAFIVAAYLGVALGVLALILYAVLDARRVKARLAALEAQGIRRRSGRRPADHQSTSAAAGRS
jgi:heme exporter protein D